MACRTTFLRPSTCLSMLIYAYLACLCVGSSSEFSCHWFIGRNDRVPLDIGWLSVQIGWLSVLVALKGLVLSHAPQLHGLPSSHCKRPMEPGLWSHRSHYYGNFRTISNTFQHSPDAGLNLYRPASVPGGGTRLFALGM